MCSCYCRFICGDAIRECVGISEGSINQSDSVVDRSKRMIGLLFKCSPESDRHFPRSFGCPPLSQALSFRKVYRQSFSHFEHFLPPELLWYVYKTTTIRVAQSNQRSCRIADEKAKGVAISYHISGPSRGGFHSLTKVSILERRSGCQAWQPRQRPKPQKWIVFQSNTQR
jgi:hypothetical protein